MSLDASIAEIPGVTVLSRRSHTAHFSLEFSVARGTEETAVRSLIEQLDDRCELWFRDWAQDDGESAVGIRRGRSGLEMMSGGHGYSSKWAPVAVADAQAVFLRLVRFSHLHSYKVHGTLERYGWELVGGSGFDAFR